VGSKRNWTVRGELLPMWLEQHFWLEEKRKKSGLKEDVSHQRKKKQVYESDRRAVSETNATKVPTADRDKSVGVGGGVYAGKEMGFLFRYFNDH